jgi:hypothetical protein
MAVLTGANGELRYNGIRIARCKDFSIDVSRDALETTSIGSYDRTYGEGMRGATGSATVIYDKDDAGTVGMVNDIFLNNAGNKAVSMILNTATNNALQFRALLTQVSTPLSVGEVVACSVSFQITGPFEGTF